MKEASILRINNATDNHDKQIKFQEFEFKLYGLGGISKERLLFLKNMLLLKKSNIVC